MTEKLTPKQDKFVDAFVRLLNGTKAYQEAYARIDADTGELIVPSDNIAAVNAVRLLRKAKIAQAFKERQKRLQTLSPICTIEELMQGWSDEIRMDISQLVDENGNLRNPNDLPPKIRRILAGYEVTEISSGDGNEPIITTRRKYKLPDKQKARIELGKRLGFYPDERIQVTGKDGKNLIPEDTEVLGKIERAVRAAHLISLALARKEDDSESSKKDTGSS